MAFCVKCGKELAKEAKFCPFCGANQIVLVKSEKKEQPQKEAISNRPATKNDWIIFIISLLLIVIMVLVAIIFGDSY